MHDAKLNPGLRVHDFNGVGQAFQLMHAGNEAAFDAQGFEFTGHPQPNFATSVSAIHMPNSSFLPCMLMPRTKYTALLRTWPSR
jgi:hypothetical protein